MKKLLTFVLIGIMLLSFGGCGVEDFDAKGYVQAVMDAKFHREYADYAEMIGVKEAEAKEQMESEFKASLETAVQAMGFSVTDEEMAQYVQMEADIRAKVKYEVKNATKDDDGNFTVEVEITPILAYDNLDTVFREKVTSALQKGATEEQYMSVFNQSLQQCIENAETGETVTFTFHVTGKESGKRMVYSISEEEMLNVDLVATGQEME